MSIRPIPSSRRLLGLVAILALVDAGRAQADDECPGATPIVLGQNGPFHNIGYTLSVPSWPCVWVQSDRWFRFTAAATTPHSFSSCGPNQTLDTTLEVFAGSCTQLQSLACNDDRCGFLGLGSHVEVMLTAGQTYFVRVGGAGAATGTFELSVALGPGSVVRSSTAGCGTATLTFSGLPALANWFTTTIGNTTGMPFLGAGFQPSTLTFCNCAVGTDWSFVFAGSQLQLPIPPDPAYLNVQFYVQGAAFGGTSGCATPALSLTDTWRITIGG